jgi:hypothetical protein
MGAAWHPECWRCGVCGKAITGPYFQHEGKPVCERDYLAAFAPRCFFCGEVLTGTFRENPFGQRACARHDHGPACRSCDRWLGRQEGLMVPLGAFGTALCGLCQREAVGHGEARNYGNAFGAAALGELGLTLPAIPTVPIRLEPALLVMQLKGSLERLVDGLTRNATATLNGRETGRAITEIIVVGGLAREHFEGVLAHEFGHVWLFHQRFDHLAEPLAEGFSELVKDRWLERLGTPLARALRRKLAESRDPVYGDGFRLLKARWDGSGLGGVMALLGDPG